MADVSKNDLGRAEKAEKKDNIFKKTGRWFKNHWKGIAVTAGVGLAAGAGGYLLGKGSNGGATEEASVPSEPVSEPSYSDLPDA